MPAHPYGTTPEVNQLLASLPQAEYAGLLPDLEAVQMDHKQYISRPEEVMDYVYFPRGAVVSILAPMEDGQSVEGATVGMEGFVGLSVFLGDGSGEEEVICQVAEPGARMSAERFRAASDRSSILHDQLHRYSLALMGQLIRTAGCNRAHPGG